ncbi:hypothetical protein [Spirosoma validum]|uniref:Uncharacterized protein n=1 Tax=Spirosoma validum TaxID=2771355 RepID=A0A927B5Q6_9BACT|nr:hypothetical protein [Spirosoma validum]MBD2755879.1 hypothetical protein [Spirosoma validum]
MKNVLQLSVLFFCCALSNLCAGQHTFTTCSAAFLRNKMIVNEYTTKGKCSVATNATGKLTVNIVELSPGESKVTTRLPFTVAIRDKNTKTLTMYSTQSCKQLPVQNVLSRCRKGDHIVLITTDNQYALPHNEILVR